MVRTGPEQGQVLGRGFCQGGASTSAYAICNSEVVRGRRVRIDFSQTDLCTSGSAHSALPLFTAGLASDLAPFPGDVREAADQATGQVQRQESAAAEGTPHLAHDANRTDISLETVSPGV